MENLGFISWKTAFMIPPLATITISITFFFNFTVRPLLADIPQRQEMAGLGILT